LTKLQIYKGKDSKIKEKPPEFSRESLLLPQRLNLSKLRRKLIPQTGCASQNAKRFTHCY
jgi:hypothetical protein